MSTPDIIDWAADNERRAAEFYELAVHRFADDTDVCALLMALAADEEDHYQLLDQMRGQSIAPFGIALDPVLEADITGVMVSTYEQLKNGAISLREMLQMAVKLEFAETNSLFLHLVATQAGHDLIDRHLQRIEAFVHEHPELQLAPIHMIPQPKWPCRILLIEPEPAFASLLAHRLSQLAWLTTACSATDAFRELANHAFDIVLLETEPGAEAKEVLDALQRDDEKIQRNLILYGRKPLAVPKKTAADPVFLPKPIQMFRLLQIIEGMLIDAQFARLQDPCV